MAERRDVLKWLASGAAAGLAGPAWSAAVSGRHASQVPELYATVPPAPSYTPALVIGTGFGGAVAALRLAQAGVSVAMLERGFAWPQDPWRPIFTNDTLPDGRGFWFRDKSKTIFGLPGVPVDRFAGVMDVTEYPNMEVWRSACVGGGSVVFTGVMIQPPQRYFDAIFGGRVSYAEMNALHYPRVRQMLRLSPMPADVYASAPFGHSRTWDRHAKLAGYTPQPVDGIWNWDVVRAELKGKSRPSCTVGLSNLGNSNGAKFDLNQNYLAQARATGRVSVHAGHAVRAIGSDGAGGYLVEVDRIAPEGTVLGRQLIRCDRLFLAAGSIGSTELLVKARAQGTLARLNEHVGSGWGTNGDTAASRLLAVSGGLTTGSACASMIHEPTRGALPVTLENWYAPGIPVNLTVGASLGMAFDMQNRGSFNYDASTDRVHLQWSAQGNRLAEEAARTVNRRIAAASWTLPGALVVKDVVSHFTAHPLGGAVLDRATDNVGRVHGHPGLYVVDGAAIPGSTGTVNPSLTIAALAERNLAAIIAAGG